MRCCGVAFLPFVVLSPIPGSQDRDLKGQSTGRFLGRGPAGNDKDKETSNRLSKAGRLWTREFSFVVVLFVVTVFIEG